MPACLLAWLGLGPVALPACRGWPACCLACLAWPACGPAVPHRHPETYTPTTAPLHGAWSAGLGGEVPLNGTPPGSWQTGIKRDLARNPRGEVPLHGTPLVLCFLWFWFLGCCPPWCSGRFWFRRFLVWRFPPVRGGAVVWPVFAPFLNSMMRGGGIASACAFPSYSSV